MSDVDLYQRDPLEFYRREVILDNGRPFGKCCDPWQLELLEAIERQDKQFAWIEMPRGHWKTGMLAALALKRMVIGRLGQKIYSAGADQDQAKILCDSLKEFVDRNPRLGEFATSKYEVRLPSKRSTYEALAADAPGAWGKKPALVLVDELSWWRKPDLFHALFSATGKMSDAQLVVITNAGIPGTWQFKLREQARKDPDWYFHTCAGIQASWIKSSWVETQRRILPPSLFARVIDNRWVAGEGSFVTEAQVAAVTDPSLEEVVQREQVGAGRRYVGCDLGLTHDMAAVATVHVDVEDGRIVLDRLRVWKGSKDDPVQYSAVEAEFDRCRELFGGCVNVADQWNMAKLIQDRPDLGIEPVSFGQKYYADLSAALYRAIANEQLGLYPEAGEIWVEGVQYTLQGQLVQLMIVDTPYGFRLDHRAGGYSDMAAALGIAVHRALQDSHGVEMRIDVGPRVPVSQAMASTGEDDFLPREEPRARRGRSRRREVEDFMP